MSRLLAKYWIDLLVWWSLTPLAFWLRLEERVVDYLPEIWLSMVILLPIKAGMVFWLGWFRRSWRRIGLRDLYVLSVGVAAATVAFTLLGMAVAGTYTIPRSVPLIEAMLAALVLGGLRMSMRLTTERYRGFTARRAARARRVLVVGAGEAGVMVVREMLRHPESGRVPVGFLDDDPSKRRERYIGLRVLGSIEELPRVVREQRVDEILIAMPSQTGDLVRRIVELARRAGVEHRTIPAIHDLLAGNVAIADIREVDLDDLLRREPVRLDSAGIASYLRKCVVLITGAGGSIGAEIARQVASYGPQRLLLVGRGEHSIYEINRELARTFPRVERFALIADVRDRESMEAIFAEHEPEVVFHAAAHKHVPLMEANPEQAVLNNVGGTRNVVELALEYGVGRFVNVSTDKAVHPSSMMGASKRVAEMIVQRASEACDRPCTYVSVRFGNVLGSRGSVVPLFKEQIRNGGPVTITHPDMTRYFMTIPEATQLVLQAGSMDANGAVYVLDMGEPIRIADLARDLIMLCGKEPGVDIEIAYTGSRPGEKLFEELLLAEEGTLPSAHEKIFTARAVNGAGDDFDSLLDRLFDATARRDRRAIRGCLADLVPTSTLRESKHSEVMIAGREAAERRAQVTG